MPRSLIASLFLAAGLNLGLSAVALAAKPHHPPPPPPPPPAWSWTGYYVGGNVGYSWGTAKTNYSSPAFGGFGLPASFPGSAKLDGAVGGFQMGYNWQANDTWVYGLETDIQGSGERGSSNLFANYFFDFPAGFSAFSGTVTSKILWFGTVRARTGVLITPTTLLYATGGLAYGEIKTSGIVSDTHMPATWAFNGSSVNAGWTVGGGIEGVVPNAAAWTWKVEYLYIDFGSISGSGVSSDPISPTYNWSARVTDNIVRVGLNYKWP